MTGFYRRRTVVQAELPTVREAGSRMSASESLVAATSWRGVVLARGERVIREYHASQSQVGGLRAFVSNLLGAGEPEGGDRHLVVTTRRLILVGDVQLHGGTGRTVREVQIDGITGLSASTAAGWMAGWALLRLIAQGLFGLLVIVVLSRVSGLFWILLVGLVWWFATALASQGRRVLLTIHARDAQSSPVSISSQAKIGRFSGRYEAFELPAAPGSDADRLTQELGALILDIQTNTDLATERWHSPALIEAMTNAGVDVGHQAVRLASPTSSPDAPATGLA